jgi:hypothetical protein
MITPQFKLIAATMALAVAGAACAGSGDDPLPDMSGQRLSGAQTSVEPREVEGIPTCESLGFDGFEFKIDPPSSGSFDIDALNSVTGVTDGVYFDWSSTLGIDVVIAKGGPTANVYEYSPESFGDHDLHSPINPSTGQPYGMSHISFCFDYEVIVEKSAETSFRRTFDWSIDKVGAETELVLSPGQTYLTSYDVTVEMTGFVDSDWAVSGTIQVTNPAPIAAWITGVHDFLEGDELPVECGVSFPFELEPGGVLECSYSAALPDGSTRTNVAHAATEGAVGEGSGEAIVDFSTAAVDGVDECVVVEDDLFGPLGEVCAAEAPKTFSYQLEIGPFGECGLYEVVNTASFEAEDSGASGSDSWTVGIEVPCLGGCTLTPGYWKTHSEHGPAPYDDTWALLSAGADTPFFSSGYSYYELLWRAPRGDAYVILAHAYIAAALNQLNGAFIGGDQATAFASATALLQAYAPGGVPKPLRPQLINLAGILDAYNNGLTGPGHCSEESAD